MRSRDQSSDASSGRSSNGRLLLVDSLGCGASCSSMAEVPPCLWLSSRTLCLWSLRAKSPPLRLDSLARDRPEEPLVVAEPPLPPSI